LGRSPAEAAAGPRGLLSDDFAPSPETLSFEPLGGQSPERPGDRDSPAGRNGIGRFGSRDLFSGLGIAPGSPARRDGPPATGPAGATGAGTADLLQRSARKTRYIRAILERSLRGGASGEQLLAQLDELTRDLDRQAAGEILYQLADHYYRHGQWPSAAEAFAALADRYPDHPLAPLAIRWLLRYYSSGEAAWRVHCDAAGQARRFERAVAIGRHVERARLDWFLEPEIRFPLAAAYRGLGDTRTAERLYQAQGQRSRDGWWQCAQGELRMSHAAAGPVKPLLPCVRVRTRPHLDGRLEKAVWRDAKRAALASAQHDDGEWPAIVMLAYDDEYLYLAAQCREPRATGSASATPGSAGATAAEPAAAVVRSGADAAAPRRPAGRGRLARGQAGCAGKRPARRRGLAGQRHAGLRRRVPLPGGPVPGAARRH
jgi:tetratricopeptide (TPR) repeat protein